MVTACATRIHGRWRLLNSSLTLATIALIALCADPSTRTSPSSGSGAILFASAQNIAGKFASRTKLDVDDSNNKKKKKKRRLFGGRGNLKEIADETTLVDGEFNSTSWKWKLFLAESRMIIISFITSVLCAVLAWMWYSRPRYEKVITKVDSGEEGAEDVVCETQEQTHTGFFQSIEVSFKDVGMVLKQKKKTKADRVILDGSIRGVAKPGRMLAIMGPSGSGKSTLLHAISGKIKYDKRITLSGHRYINQTPITGDSQIPSAFIEQEVSFFPNMTVKETLDFQVELKMGAVLKTREERDGLVKDLMDQLGLTKSANTIVGNAKVRGLSGGERKRLSIATEMISGAPLIFLDEPTSGLDSFQATQVIETLRTLANQGKTVVAVIHQPSQHTFQLFDDLLLISEGRQMYFGEVSEVRQYMTDLGYGCETEVGTAEHVLDCVSRAAGADAEADRSSTERIENIATAATKHAQEVVVFDDEDETDVADVGDSGKKSCKNNLKHIVNRSAAHPGTNIFRQFKLLMGRSVQEVLRGKTATIIKIVQQVTLGVIYGGIYTLGDNQASIMDRFGLLSLIILGATNMAMAQTIRSFPKEKAIVSGELASGMYRTFPYFISKAISEFPLIGLCNAIFGAILYPLVGLQKGKFKTFLAVTSLHTIASEAAGLLIGSVASSSDVALALFPPIIVLNIIFDGKNISDESVPYVLKWINKIGLVRWGFTGLALNEFQGLSFSSSGPFRGPVAKTGEDALARFGLDGKSLGDVYGGQMKIIVGCWFFSLLGLSLTRQKFEVMKNPPK